MPIYGYQRAVVDQEYGLLEMREVSFDLGAADLRRVAAFLRHCADRLDAGEWRSDHAHLDNFDPEWVRDHPELNVVVLHRKGSEA